MSFAQILDLAINVTENEIFRLKRDVTFQVVYRPLLVPSGAL
jgi:hypothetical protein